MNPFQGAVAVVTGGASGIGRALCVELARRGAEVVVTDIDEDGAAAVAAAITESGGRASSCALDVRNAEDFERIVGEVAARGRLDYLFNNAGIAVHGETRELGLEHWRKSVDINLNGVIHGVHSAYWIMAERGSGHIVNVASLAGLLGFPMATPYATTKFAVVGLSLSLRAEGADLGVKVSVVCPGFIQSAIFESGMYVGSTKENALALIPVRFVPADVAARIILDGVARNKAVIVLPFYAKLLAWVTRFAPWLTERLHLKTVRSFRRRRAKRPSPTS